MYSGNRDRDVENKLMDTMGAGGSGGWRCQERDEESGGAEERQVWSREMT